LTTTLYAANNKALEGKGMNKTKTLIIAAFVVVLGAIGVTTFVLTGQQQPAAQSNNQTSQQQEQTPKQDPNIVTFRGLPDETVLDQLKANATVEVKDSSYGPYVDSINGIKGGTDGKYWGYYVDGTMAQVGAGEYKTKGGEKIEWKFE
jgi:cytoskeletal protein RodZ